MSKKWKSPRRSMRGLDTALPEILGPLAENHRRQFDRARLAWAKVCGPALARHTRPQEIRDRLLVVGACGPHWREALFSARKELHQKMRRYLPSLRGIRVVSLPPLSEPKASVPPPPVVAPRADTEDIESPGLRAAMDRLLDSWERRQREEDA